MAVILTSPAEGKQPGETYTGKREQWLVDNGYAYKKRSTTDKHLATTVDADKDPTLAANREEAGDGTDFELAHTTSSSVDRQPYPEEQGAVPPTERPADLDERQAAAEADVKGQAGDGQEVSAKEEPAQDGDSDGATSTQ